MTPRSLNQTSPDGWWRDRNRRLWAGWAIAERPLLPDTPARFCGCGRELTKAEQERGETECGECR